MEKANKDTKLLAASKQIFRMGFSSLNLFEYFGENFPIWVQIIDDAQPCKDQVNRPDGANKSHNVQYEHIKMVGNEQFWGISLMLTINTANSFCASGSRPRLALAAIVPLVRTERVSCAGINCSDSANHTS